MRHRIFLLGLCAVAFLACDSANPVAPSGTVLSVSANPTQIGLNGQSTITVTGFKPDASRLNPGTQILISTSLGDLVHATTGQPVSVVEIDGNGSAFALLRANGRAGEAMVTATLSTAGGGSGGGDGDTGGGSSAGSTTQSVAVQIGVSPDDLPRISVTASPATVSLNETATITAIARNSDGTLAGSGESVQIRTDLGTLSNSGSCGGSANSVTVTTNANSEAITTLCSGEQTGTATITATFDSSEEATASVTIENQVSSLTMSANPTSISTGSSSRISILARDDNNLPVGAGQRIRLTASNGKVVRDGGTAADEAIDGVSTDSNGEAFVTFIAGDRSGMGTVSAILGASEEASVTIDINAALEILSLTADPQTIQRSDAGVMIQLQVVTTDVLGLPIQSVLVSFDTLGSLSNNPVATNSQGIATATLTVRAIDVQSIPAGGTFIITATGTREGQTKDDSVAITVLGEP